MQLLNYDLRPAQTLQFVRQRRQGVLLFAARLLTPPCNILPRALTHRHSRAETRPESSGRRTALALHVRRLKAAHDEVSALLSFSAVAKELNYSLPALAEIKSSDDLPSELGRLVFSRGARSRPLT